MTGKRFMQNPETERRLISGALWFIAACVILAILTSCSPYEDLQLRTPTPATTGTAQLSQVATIEPTPYPSCTVQTGVPAGNLNIRTGAGTQYAVIGLLREGQRLTLTGTRQDGWIEVITGNLSGWINERYCK